jgi:hypothetical protein
MKRLEDLSVGSTFELDNKFYILSTDYKNNGHRSCISLKDGSCKWISSDQFVSHSPIYYLDKDNNIVAINPTEKSRDV